MRIKLFFLASLIFCGLFSSEIQSETSYRYHVKGFYKSKKFDFHLNFVRENVNDTTYLVAQCDEFDLPEVRFSLPSGKANIEEFYSLVTAISEIADKKERKIFQIMHGLQKYFLPGFISPLTEGVKESCSEKHENVLSALVQKYENWEFEAEIDSERSIWKNLQILITSSQNEPLLLVVMTSEGEN